MFNSLGTRWATLPSSPAIDPNCVGLGATGGCPGHPEGMTIDNQGRMFVASFELPAQDGLGGWMPDPGGPYSGNLIYVFAPSQQGDNLAGKFLFSFRMPGDDLPLGMQFDNAGNLYILDVFHGNVLKYTPPITKDSTPAYVYHVCGGFVTFSCALNGATGSKQRMSPDGNIYMSDSLGPSIWEVNITTCHPSPGQSGTSACTRQFLSDPTKLTSDCPSNGLGALSFPPDFAGNGLAFDASGQNLFVDNMGEGIIYKYPVSLQNGMLTADVANATQLTKPNGNPGVCGSGPLSGPDDMVLDRSPGGLLWVSNGGASNVAGINPETGQIVETLGSARGVDNDGAPIGLLQPSSIVLHDGRLYVDNEANPSIHPAPPEGWPAYTKWTVSVLPIPGYQNQQGDFDG
jgi:sugar lactone lactonase YvrE